LTHPVDSTRPDSSLSRACRPKTSVFRVQVPIYLRRPVRRRPVTSRGGTGGNHVQTARALCATPDLLPTSAPPRPGTRERGRRVLHRDPRQEERVRGGRGRRLHRASPAAARAGAPSCSTRRPCAGCPSASPASTSACRSSSRAGCCAGDGRPGRLPRHPGHRVRRNMTVKPMAATLSRSWRHRRTVRRGRPDRDVPGQRAGRAGSHDRQRRPGGLSVTSPTRWRRPRWRPSSRCATFSYDALKSSASDVHIEPALHDLQVRMRVDGVLRDYTPCRSGCTGRCVAPEDPRELESQSGGCRRTARQRAVSGPVSRPSRLDAAHPLRREDGAALLGAPRRRPSTVSASRPANSGNSRTPPAAAGHDSRHRAHGLRQDHHALRLLAWHHKPRSIVVTVEDPIEFQLAGIQPGAGEPRPG